jgi:hypothetical protein
MDVLIAEGRMVLGPLLVLYPQVLEVYHKVREWDYRTCRWVQELTLMDNRRLYRRHRILVVRLLVLEVSLEWVWVFLRR